MSWIERYARYAWLGLRILFPTPREWRYARSIRASGLLDRTWYRETNPRLPRLCRLLPERHYVLVGEKVGLCPSPDFSPRAYSYLNPDQPRSGLPPLAHFMDKGAGGARAALDTPAGPDAPALPVIDAAALAQTGQEVAIVLHLFYREMWDEFLPILRAQLFPFDLIILLTEGAPEAEIRASIVQDFPGAHIWTFPNHGRDILPFLHLAQSGALARYKAVCKLHTKRSPHRADGAQWRQALVEGVLGDPDATQRALTAFLADPRAALWVADGHRISGAEWWGPNKARARALLERFHLDATAWSDHLEFAAGSIYWMKASALTTLAALPVSASDFEPEMGQVDGTTAHALERVLGLVLRAQGLELRERNELSALG
ncbi:MAG: rhamnan synthesis F family protein [Roseinatronobacter sp.]